MLILELQHQKDSHLDREQDNMQLLERVIIGMIILDQKQILLMILSLMQKKLKVLLMLVLVL